MKILPVLFASLVFATPLFAAENPPADAPQDARLGPLQDLDGYFPFTPSPSPEAWAVRAERVRMQMRVALGIWPEPTRTPLNAVIHGRVEGGDYTVEKVFFESMPGFFVTGNLYRPAGKSAGEGKHAGVLCPHGHWDEGRFLDSGEKAVAKEIANGAEQFAEGGRSVLQARCVQLARLGCVVFHYDMLGYADSTQLSFALTHKFAKQRPETPGSDGWVLFSAEAEARAQSVMGLQTWNGIRALDFLTALPDVDARRIGVTGASGGGTQTMILAALDPRVTAAFPAVMVSTAMQGGCTCENASGLRISTGNVEFAALFAPKPMAMTAANDWTKEMETKGFPELQKHWAMLGAPQHVQLTALVQFPHNYNAPSRAAMYAWFNQHLALGQPAAQLAERDYVRLSREEMTVWDDAHPAPAGGDDFERKLLRWWHDDAQAQMAKSPEEFRIIAAPAWAAIIGRTLADAGEVEMAALDPKAIGAAAGVQRTEHGEFLKIAGALRNRTHGEELPAVLLQPEKPSARTVAWLCENGTAQLFAEDGKPRAEIARLLDAGCIVLGVDMRMGKGAAANRVVKNPREAPAYTYGYNHPLFAQRVHDVLSALHFARNAEPKAALSLVGLGATGPIAAAARALSGDAVDAAVIDTGHFRFADVADYRAANFLPAAAKYGDLPGLLTLAAPRPVFVIGEGESAPVPAALDWLLKQGAKQP